MNENRERRDYRTEQREERDELYWYKGGRAELNDEEAMRRNASRGRELS